MKNIWSIALSPTTPTASQRASWLASITPTASRICRQARISVNHPHVRRLPHTYSASAQAASYPAPGHPAP